MEELFKSYGEIFILGMLHDLLKPFHIRFILTFSQIQKFLISSYEVISSFKILPFFWESSTSRTTQTFKWSTINLASAA